MPKVTPEVLEAVEEALTLYRDEVEASDMRFTTRRIYVNLAEAFVRWLNDEFTPGRGYATRRPRLLQPRWRKEDNSSI